MEDQGNSILQILQTGVIYLIIQLCGSGFSAGIIALTNTLQAEIAFRSQVQLFRSLIKTSIAAIKESNLTDFNSSLIKDTESISQNILQPYVDAVNSIFTFLFGFYFMMRINVILTLMILPLGIISSFTIRYVNGKSTENLKRQRESLSELWKVFHEGIYGFLPIRIHKYTKQYLDKMQENGERLRDIQISQGHLESLAFFGTRSLFMSTVGIILIAAAVLVTKNKVSVGGVTAILMYNYMLTDPFLKLLTINQNIIRVKVSFQRVKNIMNLPKHILPASYQNVDKVKIERLSKTIKEREILRDVSFEIQSESSFAIFGETGSGKSTLANLISGIDLPDFGTITYSYLGAIVKGTSQTL